MLVITSGVSPSLGPASRPRTRLSLPRLSRLRKPSRAARQPRPVKAKEDVNKELREDGKMDPQVSKTTDALVEMGAPIVNNLGFSGLAGLAVGITVKVVGSFLAVVLGLGFVVLQVLSYYGIIDIKWKVLEDNLVNSFDVSGDGKLDKEDAKIILDSGLRLLSQGVPSVAGFCGGLLLGIKFF